VWTVIRGGGVLGGGGRKGYFSFRGEFLWLSRRKMGREKIERKEERNSPQPKEKKTQPCLITRKNDST